MKLDVERSVRKIGRGVGRGVAEVLEERSTDRGEEPGWRAEQLAEGFLRGVDRGLREPALRETVGGAIVASADVAISAVLARSPGVQELSEETARALTRGVLDEVRRQLGDRGDGPLTRALGAAVVRLVRNTAHELAPAAVATAVGGLALGALLLLRRR